MPEPTPIEVAVAVQVVVAFVWLARRLRHPL